MAREQRASVFDRLFSQAEALKAKHEERAITHIFQTQTSGIPVTTNSDFQIDKEVYERVYELNLRKIVDSHNKL